MIFADDSDDVIIAKVMAPILATLVVGVVVWLKAAAAAMLAKRASDKADTSHEIVVDIHKQTNSRLAELDAKLREHERRCIENARTIAELKLALAEALRGEQP